MALNRSKSPERGWSANGLSTWLALILLSLASVLAAGSPAHFFAGEQVTSTVNAPAPQEHKGVDSNYTTHKSLSQFQREIRASRIDDNDKDTLSPPDIIALPSRQLGKIQTPAGHVPDSLHAGSFLFERTAQPRAPPFLA